MSLARNDARERPRTVPVHRSLSRPILFAGGDRISMGVLGISCIALIVATGFSVVAFFAVGAVLLLGTWLIQKATRADAQFREVYIRHRPLPGRGD